MSEAGDPVESISEITVEAAASRLREAIRAAGLTLFAEIDHAAGARAAGLEMPPTLVLLYGAAAGGTPVMLAAPDAALDLPLRVLVRRRADGRTSILFHPAADMLRRHHLPAERLRPLAAAQSLLLRALSDGAPELPVTPLPG